LSKEGIDALLTRKPSSELPGCELPFSCHLPQNPGSDNPKVKIVIKIHYQLPQKTRKI